MAKHVSIIQKDNTIKIVLDGHEIDDVVDCRLQQDNEAGTQVLHLTIAIKQSSIVTNDFCGGTSSALRVTGFDGNIND